MNKELHGLEELRAKLQGLAGSEGVRVARFGAKKGAEVWLKAAQEKARALDDPKTAESIEKNLVVRRDGFTERRTGDIKFRVGVLGGARDYSAYGEIKTGKSATENPGGDTFYWRFLEFGTKHIPARSFMRPAQQDNLGKATDTVFRELDKALDRALKRVAKGTGSVK